MENLLNDISLYNIAFNCTELVTGDKDIVWLSKKDIWLYRCETCHCIYYAHRIDAIGRVCPCCEEVNNAHLDCYNDLKKAIAEIEDRVSVRYGEHKTIQQIIEEKENEQ